jgi:ComF family protein
MYQSAKMIQKDILNLLYPNLCAACNAYLSENEQVICISCELRLPLTHYHLSQENPIMKKFWGRLPLLHAASFYLFLKTGRVQQLMHQLKYRNNTMVGERVGQLYAQQLLNDEVVFTQADLIIPIPLHYKKLRQRGYNQSDYFAKGLSEKLKIPWSNLLLEKVVNTDSQTGKNRIQRGENVENVFKVKESNAFIDKHVVLVDDVVTTGSTLEACAYTIINKWQCKLSVLTIASAI